MTKELEIIDHDVAGNLNLLSQYKDSPIFKVLLDTFTSKLNEIETEIFKFKADLTIDSAVGRNLDLIGDTLAAPTRPVDDDTFRNVLYGLVAAYNSEGRASDLDTLIRKLIIAEQYNIIDGPAPAVFSIELTGITIPADPAFLTSIIELSKSAGVQFDGFTVTPVGFSPIFAFESDLDGDAGPFSVISPPPVIPAEAPYPNYVFAPNGTISETGRFTSVNLSTDTFVIVTADDAAGTDFRSQLDTNQTIPNSKLGIVDSIGSPWVFTTPLSVPGDNNGGVSGTSIVNDYEVGFNRCDIEWYGQFINNTFYLANFSSYDQTQESTFNTNNPVGLVINDPTNRLYYNDFVFAPNGTLTTANRVRVHTTGALINMELYVAIANGPGLFNEITDAIDNSGVLELRARFARRFRMVFGSNTKAAIYQDFGDYAQIDIELSDSGIDNMVLLNNRNNAVNFLLPEDAADFNTGFSDYSQLDEASYNLFHSVGIIKENRITTEFYDVYQFAAEAVLADTDRVEAFSTDVDNQGLSFVLTDDRGQPFYSDLVDFDKVDGYLQLVDQLGAVWKFTSLGGYKLAVYTDQTGSIRLDLHMRKGGVDVAAITKDGLAQTPAQLVSDFSPYDDTQESDWNTNNPLGIFRIGDEILNGGYYAQQI